MNEELNQDEFHAHQRIIGKTYFSKSFIAPYSNLLKKFAHKILDHEGNEYLLKDEKTLGHNIIGLRQLKALFLHDENRKIDKLILQQFDAQKKPIKKYS